MSMAARSEKMNFPGSHGTALAARLDWPASKPKALALFAHCFTCSKDLFAASRIAGELTQRDFAVCRFDFTGLGMSEGEFANTNFSSNVQDLLAAAAHLREKVMPAGVLIGHSLGGAAVLAAAADLTEVRAVATIGAPSDAVHVTNNFAAHVGEIRAKGEATVSLAGRNFTIKRQFLEDVEGTRLHDRIASMRKALLIFHSPIDATVGIENASAIFAAAKHPKSFVSLTGADHLLSKREDAAYVAEVLSAWASRYIMGTAEAAADNAVPDGEALIMETGASKLQNAVRVGPHRLLADEPVSNGGSATGPDPYDYLNIALGACTSMTMRIYAERKQIPAGKIQVRVRHEKRKPEGAPEGQPLIDHFQRFISIGGDVSQEDRGKLIAIANRCPVHNTLTRGSTVETKEDLDK
jgi:uncharacterized OsmC-like protein/pimeloyl-ACP methyl ester carboxylesterase